QVTQTSHAGFGANGRLADLQAWVAQRTLFCLAGLVVEVDLLIRAAGDTHAPTAALILVHQDDAVLLTFVLRTRWAGGHTGGVAAVPTDAGEIEHEGIFNLLGYLEVHLLQDGILIQGRGGPP